MILVFLARLSKKAPFSRLNLLLILVTSLVAGLANTGLIVLTNRLLGNEWPPLWTGGAFIVLCLALPLCRFASRALLVRLTQSSLHEFRLQMCRRILSSPLRQIEQLGMPRLQAALVNDLVQITDALGRVPELLLHILVVLGCMIYLATLSWTLLLVLLCVMAVGVVTYQLPMMRVQRYQRLARDQWDELFADIRGVTQGAKELKMHRRRREEFLSEQLGASAEALKHYSIRTGVTFSAAMSWGQILFFAAIGALLFLTPAGRSMDREVLTGFVLVIFYMMGPLEVILATLPQISNAEVSVRNIESLGLSLSAQPVEEDASEEVSSWKRVDLKDVTHIYRREGEEDSFLLGPIDLSVRPGEVLFLTGGNGSGKTTLAKILLGLYVPQSGEVQLDGVPVTDANRDAYRQLFSVVFSDFFLFRRLMGLGGPDLDARAAHYLARLHLQDKAQVIGGEVSSLDLSQGQRKRLALLTAYLEDRPIYLFDEWASDQDPAFKEIFYRELLPELKARGKTVIAISHDDRYYGVADRIVKLADGQVEHDGPATALMDGTARHAAPGSLRNRIDRALGA